MQATGYYNEGSFLPWYGYVYVTAITFASVTVSMYCLVWFYIVTQEDLAPYNPVPKFLCIKAILFFSFWQSVLIAVLAYFQIIPESEGQWTQENISRGVQDFIICIEMFILSVVHIFVFPFSTYKVDTGDFYISSEHIIYPVKHFAGQVINQSDVVSDVKKAYHPKEFKAARKQHREVKKRYREKLQEPMTELETELSAGEEEEKSEETP